MVQNIRVSRHVAEIYAYSLFVCPYATCLRDAIVKLPCVFLPIGVECPTSMESVLLELTRVPSLTEEIQKTRITQFVGFLN